MFLYTTHRLVYETFESLVYDLVYWILHIKYYYSLNLVSLLQFFKAFYSGKPVNVDYLQRFFYSGFFTAVL